MNRLLLVALLLSGCSPAPWTKADTVRQGVFFALTGVDWHQTRGIASEKWSGTVQNADGGTTYYNGTVPRYHEYNPILGEHPSQGSVDAYFAAAVVGHAAISYLLPPRWRAWWQYLGIGAQGFVVYHNWGEGIR
jgi:hypothetical protein